MKNKLIKWGFKLWCRWCSKTGYLYKFNLYLDKKEKNRAWAFGIVVSDLSKKLWKYTLDALFWQLFLILQHCLKTFSIGEYTVLVQFEVTGKVWLLWKKIKMSKEVTLIFSMLLTWLLWNGLIIVESQWLVHFLRNVIKYQQLQVEQKDRVPKCLSHTKRLSKITDRHGWVDLLVRKTAACKMDHKSSGRRYYLRLLFDLMNISVVDSHAIYKVFYQKRMESLDFKSVLFQNWYV